jgi:hypothetical protein
MPQRSIKYEITIVEEREIPAALWERRKKSIQLIFLHFFFFFFFQAL